MERSTNYFLGSSVGRHQDLIVIRKRKVNPFASFLHVMWYVFWTMTEATEQIYLSTTGAATSSNPIIEGTLPCRQHCRSDEGGASVVVFFLFCSVLSSSYYGAERKGIRFNCPWNPTKRASNRRWRRANGAEQGHIGSNLNCDNQADCRHASCRLSLLKSHASQSERWPIPWLSFFKDGFEAPRRHASTKRSFRRF